MPFPPIAPRECDGAFPLLCASREVAAALTEVWDGVGGSGAAEVERLLAEWRQQSDRAEAAQRVEALPLGTTVVGVVQRQRLTGVRSTCGGGCNSGFAEGLVRGSVSLCVGCEEGGAPGGGGRDGGRGGALRAVGALMTVAVCPAAGGADEDAACMSALACGAPGAGLVCTVDGEDVACPPCVGGGAAGGEEGEGVSAAGSKKGLLGLLGLLAIVPLLCCVCVVVAVCVCGVGGAMGLRRRRKEAALEQWVAEVPYAVDSAAVLAAGAMQRPGWVVSAWAGDVGTTAYGGGVGSATGGLSVASRAGEDGGEGGAGGGGGGGGGGSGWMWTADGSPTWLAP